MESGGLWAAPPIRLQGGRVGRKTLLDTLSSSSLFKEFPCLIKVFFDNVREELINKESTCA
jgi:hypothetical protein